MLAFGVIVKSVNSRLILNGIEIQPLSGHVRVIQRGRDRYEQNDDHIAIERRFVDATHVKGFLHFK